MNRYEFGDTVYYTNNAFDGYGAELMMQHTIDEIDPEQKRYVEVYSALKNLAGYAILDVEEMEGTKAWCYSNGKRAKKIQNWIKSHDGKFLALIVYCGNSKRCAIKTQKSIALLNGEMFVPKSGYIDNYTIEYDTAKLSEKLNKRKRGNKNANNL